MGENAGMLFIILTATVILIALAGWALGIDPSQLFYNSFGGID